MLGDTSNINHFDEKAIFRGSRPEVFLRKGVLKICSKFTGEPTHAAAYLLHIFRTRFYKNICGKFSLTVSLLKSLMSLSLDDQLY